MIIHKVYGHVYWLGYPEIENNVVPKLPNLFLTENDLPLASFTTAYLGDLIQVGHVQEDHIVILRFSVKLNLDILDVKHICLFSWKLRYL